MEKIDTKYHTASLLKFIIPSLIGISLFMIPMKIDGQITIPIAFMANFIEGNFTELLKFMALILISLSVVGSVVIKLFKPKFLTKNTYLNNLFNVTPLWFIARILGMIFIICAFFKIGPEFIWSENTGGLVLNDLLPILIAVFLFAGFLLPLLLDFGLLEFVGSLLTKFMRPIFNLPGRSSIDCIASWLGDGSIGILLTSKQYEQGFYTKREAAVIGTTFSAVSITFCLVIISQVGLAHMFLPFYLTVTLSGIVAAIIIPRIPPLSRKKDDYFGGQDSKNLEVIPEGYTPFSWGLEKAVEKASDNTHPKEFVISGIKNVLDMWIGVLAIVMAMGGIALMIAEYTSIFQVMGTPFIPLLKLLGVPEAAAAAQTLVVGFADMFIPSVLATSITSEMTRFIVACISVTQLIYMSEVGGLLLGSKIPVGLKDLVILFIERTIITLPVIVIMANIFF
ncbi:YjiH family protein [Clostridium sardiniense]|uniref:YjiH family protein n=1 Tax=Clostridium sardiniense TaxID=29369 RepID=A0ABS7KYV9_CLOSR|nr:YjiH family protein [Clostridium sardiniense]MBY0755944.1 YjiH family protein [Clostridium sardiniense]MDQ0461326.1 nucleoside recognition membrane protein YjiH [Clostridium sardiniense]